MSGQYEKYIENQGRGRMMINYKLYLDYIQAGKKE